MVTTVIFTRVHSLSLAYEERLQELGWTTLTERRQTADMTLVNGVLAGRTDINPADWFMLASDSDRGTRSAADKLNLKVSHGRLDTRSPGSGTLYHLR